jgi:hypothetical protein
MKRFVWVLVLLVMAAPTWAANKKISVQQLNDLLVSMQQRKKTDAEIANQLKEIDLSEELTATTMSNLLFASPGPLTSEQISVLGARSSMLVPPPSDLPSLPAPDSAAQKAILDRAIDVAAKSNQQSPHLTALKAISRYGHLNEFSKWGHWEGGGSWQGGVTREPGNRSIMYLTSRFTESVDLNQGAEKVSASSDDPRLRRLIPTPEGGTRPSLSQILRQASENGNIHWMRWEAIGSNKTAVFSFTVGKKESIYSVDYCCFLTEGNNGHEWKPFKKRVGYHGEFFIEPDTGNTLRTVMQAEFAPTDFVEREDTRIDYGTTAIDGNIYVVPVGSYTYSDVDSSGDSFKGYVDRRAYLVCSYADYRLAGSSHK